MEPQLTTPSEITVLNAGTVLTIDGLTLKGTDSVELINVRVENSADYMFYSWQACWTVRGDFNFVASKMFNRECRNGGPEQVRSLVQEVKLQAEMRALECIDFDAQPHAQGRTVLLRLVIASAAGLFKAFQMGDTSYAKLSYAVEICQLAENLVHGYTQSFEDALSDLKMHCSTGNQKQKPAFEIAKTEGIV